MTGIDIVKLRRATREARLKKLTTVWPEDTIEQLYASFMRRAEEGYDNAQLIFTPEGMMAENEMIAERNYANLNYEAVLEYLISKGFETRTVAHGAGYIYTDVSWGDGL